MPRAKRGFKARRRRKRIFKQTEGFVLGRRNKFRRAIETLHRAWCFAFRDRKNKKRDFRRLWNTRISAAANNNDMSYSRLIGGLKKAEIRLNRKMLADIAVHDPQAFTSIVSKAKSS